MAQSHGRGEDLYQEEVNEQFQEAYAKGPGRSLLLKDKTHPMLGSVKGLVHDLHSFLKSSLLSGAEVKAAGAQT